jgi:carnitine 3-dehydrogenase
MAQAGGRSVADLERYRDDALISVMETLAQVKARHGMAPDA